MKDAFFEPSFILPQLKSTFLLSASFFALNQFFFNPPFLLCQPLAFFSIIPFPSTASFIHHD